MSTRQRSMNRFSVSVRRNSSWGMATRTGAVAATSALRASSSSSSAGAHRSEESRLVWKITAS